MEKILGIILAAVGLALMLLVLGIPLALLNGWVISWLWLWFLVPLGIPAIGVVHAMGISGIIGLLTKQYVPKSDTGESFSFSIVFPLVCLLTGYVIHLFM